MNKNNFKKSQLHYQLHYEKVPHDNYVCFVYTDDDLNYPNEFILRVRKTKLPWKGVMAETYSLKFRCNKIWSYLRKI